MTAWFISLAYLAMLWANATSLPLFARYFMGEIFHFGRMYTLFGYDVYLGEALLTIAAILLVAFLCANHTGIVTRLMSNMALLFSGGITFCFLAALFGQKPAFAPAVLPDTSALRQVLHIACISPWAFIGIESVSHGAEEFSFKRSRIFPIMIVSVVSTTALYIFATLLSASVYPEEYGSWLAYIRDLDNLTGIRGLPAFYAAERCLGSFGVGLLVLSLFCLIATSLVGNTMALSRLFRALAADRLLPERIGELNRSGAPGKAIGLIAAISCVVLFLGRTVIGWIVDVTVLCATLVYGFVSAAAFKLAGTQGDRVERRTGAAGLVFAVFFGLNLLVPNLYSVGTIEMESYFLFAAWALLGFFFFRFILRRDKEKRFGKSIIVWIALLSLILFVSLVWLSQSVLLATGSGMRRVEEYYLSHGIPADETGIVLSAMSSIRMTNARSLTVVVAVFVIALAVLLNNYSIMSRRAHESESKLHHVRNLANTDPLTGVKSKHAYAEHEQELDGEITAGTAKPFAIAVCDVNGLKLINDTLGHKAGDEHIRSASRMICELFQHSPVYRTGGDEFVVCLTGRDYAARKAIMRDLHEMSVAHIESGEVVVSGGLSEFDPDEDRRMQDVFARADAAMYREKQALKALGAPTR